MLPEKQRPSKSRPQNRSRRPEAATMEALSCEFASREEMPDRSSPRPYHVAVDVCFI